MTEVKDKGDFERRLQSIAQALTVALLVGYGVGMVDLVKSVARLEVIKEQTSRELHDLKTEIGALRVQVMTAAISASNAATAAAQAAAAAAQAAQRK